MTFRASKISGSLGVYVRGRDGGNAYMWQLSQSERSLRPHVKTNGNYSVLTATPFPAGFDFAAEHEYAITVDGTTIVTKVDGVVLDTRTVATHTAPGLVGFRTSGAETGAVSDAKVTSESGESPRSTRPSPSGDRTFTAGTVQGGDLVVAGNTEPWYAFGADVPVLRTEFDVDKEVESARIYAAARGLYELQLNGEPVGDQQLAPGWTDYNTRIQYQTYDVTDQLGDGDNAIGAEIADGWYAGRVAMFGDSIYGSDTSLIAQLRIRYTDGSRAGRRDRRHLAHDERAHVHPPTCSTARRTTRGARQRSGRGRSPATTTATGRRPWSVRRPRRSSNRRPHRRCGSPRSSTRRRSRVRPTACTSTTSGRTWSATRG